MTSKTLVVLPRTEETLEELRSRYPGVGLVACGQTVFWDEPVKAVLSYLLDGRDPGRRIHLYVHDTDYFAKTTVKEAGDCTYPILPHNDGSTRDLWVAAGELSQLFGSETIPSRDLLTAHGVRLEKAVKGYPQGKETFIDDITEAWGWRGIAYNGSRKATSHQVRLADVLPSLTEILRWGFEGTARTLARPEAEAKARETADELLRWVGDFAARYPQATLSCLYEHLFPRFFSALPGFAARNIEVSSSMKVFRFNRQTSCLPRFKIIDYFLNPVTRPMACAAYDHAVRGTEMYTLDRFGPGAIPFDLVIPGRGRGTLHVTRTHVTVDTDPATSIPLKAPVDSAAALASVLEEARGPEVTLVGKAVSFISMMTGEYIMLLSEGGSPYVFRTQKMLARMVEDGIGVDLYPILRLHYHTWDSLASVDTTFRLPEHLASSFGQETVEAAEFAGRWHAVIEEQHRLLNTLESITSPRELMTFLHRQDEEQWKHRLTEYIATHDRVLEIDRQAETMKAEIARLRALEDELKARVSALELEKGSHYREHIKPLRQRLWELSQEGVGEGEEVDRLKAGVASHEERRAGYDRQVAECREAIRKVHQDWEETRKAYQALDKSPETIQAEKHLAALESEAEIARARLIRDAVLTSRGLVHTNHRPTAWWFLMVDPSRGWFRRVAETTELYLEPVTRHSTEGC
ncbi:MAG: hypothetical protein IT210_21905 [Armatimonadetes bacterium]|nr:hypothetical protein [Armatimonadota bacterium]